MFGEGELTSVSVFGQVALEREGLVAADAKVRLVDDGEVRATALVHHEILVGLATVVAVRLRAAEAPLSLGLVPGGGLVTLSKGRVVGIEAGLVVTVLLEEGLLILVPLALAVALNPLSSQLETTGSDVVELLVGELDVASHSLIEGDVAAERQPGHRVARPEVELVDKKFVEARRPNGDEVDGGDCLQGEEASVNAFKRFQELGWLGEAWRVFVKIPEILQTLPKALNDHSNEFDFCVVLVNRKEALGVVEDAGWRKTIRSAQLGPPLADLGKASPLVSIGGEPASNRSPAGPGAPPIDETQSTPPLSFMRRLARFLYHKMTKTMIRTTPRIEPTAIPAMAPVERLPPDPSPSSAAAAEPSEEPLELPVAPVPLDVLPVPVDEVEPLTG